VIFTRTKHRAKNLARELEANKFRVTELQGNLSQSRRQSAMTGFREGKYDMLVATDIAAHGIDVSEVSHVINFDIPDTVDAYTHRIGRTGRALHTGEAFTLATPNDALTVRAVERTLKTRIERRTLPGFDYGNFSPEKQSSQPAQSQPWSGQPQPNGGPPDSAASSSQGSPNRGANPRRKPFPPQSSGRPRTAGGSGSGRHPRSRGYAAPGRSSR